ncbi:hypothetical protein RRG08_015245 [Elysia crispata]|uniref:Uncharacterized protein n=1 Tax=Elysia crispata TaxID=231223 RepID=A0AAE0Z0W4_9GAST|nr:hypothetical protein RRG08_015245 [Elysia crispata]
MKDSKDSPERDIFGIIKTYQACHCKQLPEGGFPRIVRPTEVSKGSPRETPNASRWFDKEKASSSIMKPPPKGGRAGDTKGLRLRPFRGIIFATQWGSSRGASPPQRFSKGRSSFNFALWAKHIPPKGDRGGASLPDI